MGKGKFYPSQDRTPQTIKKTFGIFDYVIDRPTYTNISYLKWPDVSYTLLYPVANLTTYTILSLFSLQVELAPRLLSP